MLISSVMQASSQVLTLDRAIHDLVYQTTFAKEQKLAYESDLLQHENYRKSYLPAFNVNLSPVGFNHSMRLLQNYMTGEYTNVNDFSNSSNLGMSITQKVGLTGGSLNLRSSLNYLYEFANRKNSFSTTPLYIGYTQSLFGGMRLYSYERRIQEKRHETALKHYCASISLEQQEIASLYLDAYLAMADTTYFHRKVAIGDSLLWQSHLKREQGKITEYDYSQIELEQTDNQIQLRKSLFAHSIAMEKLSERLHFDVGSLAPLDVSALPRLLDENWVNELICRNNPDWQDWQLRCLSAEQTFYQSDLATRFNADISVGYGLNQYGYSLTEAYHSPDQQQSMMVTFNIPVFQWGINRNKRIIAQNEYQTVLLEHEKQMEDLRNEVHELVFAYNSIIDMVSLAAKRYKLSGEQYLRTVRLYNAGKVSLIELQGADKEHMESKQAYLSAIQEVYIHYFKIRHLTLFDFVVQKNLSDEIE